MDTQNYSGSLVNYNNFGAGSAMYEFAGVGAGAGADSAQGAGDTQGRVPLLVLPRLRTIENGVTANSKKLDGLAANVDSNADALNDVRGQLAGFSSNFNRIDRGLNNLNKKADSQTAKLQGIATNVDATKDGVTALNQKVQTLDGQVTGLNGKLDGVAAGVGTIGVQNKAIFDKVDSIANNCCKGSLHQTPAQPDAGAGKPQTQS